MTLVKVSEIKNNIRKHHNAIDNNHRTSNHTRQYGGHEYMPKALTVGAKNNGQSKAALKGGLGS